MTLIIHETRYTWTERICCVRRTRLVNQLSVYETTRHLVAADPHPRLLALAFARARLVAVEAPVARDVLYTDHEWITTILFFDKNASDWISEEFFDWERSFNKNHIKQITLEITSDKCIQPALLTHNLDKNVCKMLPVISDAAEKCCEKCVKANAAKSTRIKPIDFSGCCRLANWNWYIHYFHVLI